MNSSLAMKKNDKVESPLPKVPVIALLGQPNSGKSTLFNALTGSRQHVGNWPGKTVEKKEGYFIKSGSKYKVTDLPGTYSLSANSEEEIITRDYVSGGNADVVCILADASQLERSLFMVADYAGLNCPSILLLNLMDIAEGQGKKIDVEVIEERIGIPVVPFVAADKKEYDAFYSAIDRAISKKTVIKTDTLFKYYNDIDDNKYTKIYDLIPSKEIKGYSAKWLAAKIIEGDKAVADIVYSEMGKNEKQAVEDILSEVDNGALLTAGCKFQWIDDLLKDTVQSKTQSNALSKFDRYATSKRWGKPLAIAIILLGLLLSFVPAAPIMMIGMGLSSLGGSISEMLLSVGAPLILVELLCKVALNTVAFAISMIGFVFGVNLVFGLIEEMGYMARVSYVFDNTMAKLGLQGKAVMPFLVSFGCTIGGAAGARVIDSWSQRVLTIALAWVVPCAATWTIVPVLSAIFFGAWMPVIILAIFAVAGLHMLITAKLFGRKLITEGNRAGLIMELPPYHKPKMKALFRAVFLRTGDILKRALKIIFIVSFIFWLVTFSSTGAQDQTLLYRFGQMIEPVTLFFGFTWQTFLAFVSSMVSKEAALGVLSALYVGGASIFESTLGGAGVAGNLMDVLRNSLTQPQALAFIFAVTFNAPCLMAVSSTYQETRSLKWTLRITGYYVGVSLIIAFIVFHIASLFL